MASTEPPLATSQSSQELEVAIAAALVDTGVDGPDIEAGTMPIIELSAVSETISLAEATHVSGDSCSDHDIEAAAVVEAPPGESGIITAEDLESSPIAHLVQHGTISNSHCSDNESTSEENRSLPLLERRAEFISATVIKAKESTPMGFGLMCNNGEVLISSIAPGTVAATTPFRVGDRMLSVNAKRCYIMDSKAVAQLMASLVGGVTIVVHYDRGDPNLVESMITRPTPETRCGLGLVSTGRSRLKISNIDKDGLFFESLLNVGDPVVTINGEDCAYSDAQDAGDLIARAGRHITIKAKTLLETGVVVAAFSCNNSTGSTIPPQIMNALNQHEDMQASTTQLVSLTLAACVLILLVLVTGFL